MSRLVIFSSHCTGKLGVARFGFVQTLTVWMFFSFLQILCRAAERAAGVVAQGQGEECGVAGGVIIADQIIFVRFTMF